MARINYGRLEGLGSAYARGSAARQSEEASELQLADTTARQEAQREVGGGSLAGFYGQRSRQQESLESQRIMDSLMKTGLAIGKRTGDEKLATDYLKRGINHFKSNFPSIASRYPDEADYPALTFPKEKAKVSAWVEGRNPEGKRVKIGYSNTGEEVTRVLVGPSEGERKTSREIDRLQEDWKTRYPGTPVPSSIPALKARLKSGKGKPEYTEGRARSRKTQLLKLKATLNKTNVVDVLLAQQFPELEDMIGQKLDKEFTDRYKAAIDEELGFVGKFIPSSARQTDTQTERTATDPNTGKRSVFRNGKWVPFE